MECENCGKEVRDNLEHWSRGYERWFCSRREKEQSPTEAPSIATGVCQRCDGKGYLRIKEKDEQWTSTQPCPDCKGTGKQSGEKGEVGVQQTELEEAVKKVAHKAKKEDMKTWDEVMK